MGKRDYKIFAAISDIHIGKKHIKPKDLKKQLKKHFFETLEGFSRLDAIFVVGDLSDQILSLNSENANLYYWFASRVYQLAKKKKSTVIMVKGTAAHDLDQLSNLKEFVDLGLEEGVDFRIYETYEEITIWDDYKVLILPDIKVKDDKEIDKYLKKNKAYDIVLLHGMTENFQYVEQESENMPTKPYIYKIKDLEKCCVGPVLAGHIHNYSRTNEKVFYCGPFTLLERGGRTAGFLVGGIYDKDRSKYRIEHYDNTDAGEYYDLEVTPEILKDIQIDDLVEAIQKLADETKDNDLFTLRITREDDMTSADKVMILENRFRRDPRFSIVKKILSQREVERQAEVKERKEKYSYLMDESIDLPAILWSYYKTDVRPTIPDQTSVAASLTEQDFVDALETKE